MSCLSWKTIAFVIAALLIAAPTAAWAQNKPVTPQQTQKPQDKPLSPEEKQKILNNMGKDLDQSVVQLQETVQEAKDFQNSSNKGDLDKAKDIADRIYNLEKIISTLKMALKNAKVLSPEQDKAIGELMEESDSFDYAFRKAIWKKEFEDKKGKVQQEQAGDMDELNKILLEAFAKQKAEREKEQAERLKELDTLQPEDLWKLKTGTSKTEMKIGTGDGKPMQDPKTQSMTLPSNPSTFSNTSTMGNTKGGTAKMMKTDTGKSSISSTSPSAGMNVIGPSNATTMNLGTGGKSVGTGSAVGGKGKTTTVTKTGSKSSGTGGATMNTTVGRPTITFGGGGLGF